jgi:predicted short-subunit dehydrogenase-like oxidoreductase (DUF2520 family)
MNLLVCSVLQNVEDRVLCLLDAGFLARGILENIENRTLAFGKTDPLIRPSARMLRRAFAKLAGSDFR